MSEQDDFTITAHGCVAEPFLGTSMIPSFFQKPFGAITLLTAAVGGPYAAYETEMGTSLRRSLLAVTASNSGTGNDSNLNLSANDPASLTAMSHGYFPADGQSHSNVPMWNPTNQTPYVSNASSGQPQTGQMVSQVYGPATVYPMPVNSSNQGGVQTAPHYPGTGPYLNSNQNHSNHNLPAGPPGFGYQSAFGTGYGVQPMEQRSGQSTPVSGSTAQLWDYTLGTPTLSQLQQQPNANIGGGMISDLREVLRFDITPAWLPQRFSRVTTVTSEIQMDGLRVPLISGTRSNDVAGSLTYFFDASQSLKRIQLHGMTGDPSALAQLMVNFYQLRPEQSLGGQLFTTRWNNRITSVMQIAPAPIIYSGADHSKYIVFLELNQPSNQYGLSQEATDILRNAQSTQRWQ